MNETQNQITKLKDGRTLGFADYGDVYGTPVFHFNGSCGSRLEHPVDLEILENIGVRLISTDRPGHGLSDLQPDRTLLGWPDDIVQLAEHLGIDKFYVLGWSAGGPHTLTCTHKYPEKVIAAGVVSGLAPPDRPKPYAGLSFGKKLLMFAMRKSPGLVCFFRMQMVKALEGDVETVGKRLSSGFPKSDQLLLESSANCVMLVEDIREGFKQGWEGVVYDDLVINNPWGFSIRDIKVPVHIWQGEMDENVPIQQGKYQHEMIPNSELSIVEGQAHLYLLAKWKEVFLN